MSRGERGSPADLRRYYLSHTVLIKDERNAPSWWPSRGPVRRLGCASI